MTKDVFKRGGGYATPPEPKPDTINFHIHIFIFLTIDNLSILLYFIRLFKLFKKKFTSL